MVILLDLPVKESINRINGRSIRSEFDKIIELQKKVRKNYLKLAEKFSEIRIINALAPVEDIHNDITALVEHELFEKAEG